MTKCKSDVMRFEEENERPATSVSVMDRKPLREAHRASEGGSGGVVSDGSTASYYELPPGAAELQDLIAYLNCNAQLGEIGRAWFRYGKVAHSPKARDLKKIIFYAQAELERLRKYEPEGFGTAPVEKKCGGCGDKEQGIWADYLPADIVDKLRDLDPNEVLEVENIGELVTHNVADRDTVELRVSGVPYAVTVGDIVRKRG